MSIQNLKSGLLRGLLIPRIGGKEIEYSLITPSGFEYQIVFGPEWTNTLEKYCWQQAKVFGLLDPAQLTMIPQRILPDDKQKKESRITDSYLISKNKFKKLFQRMGELIFIPIALCAVFGSLNFWI